MRTSHPAIRRTITAGVAATILALATAAPAGAWGERTAYRSCGANWIESWATPAGGHANTIKLSGSCSGQLQVGLRSSSGLTRWLEGSSRSASLTLNGKFVGGLHRGCYSCATSFT